MTIKLSEAAIATAERRAQENGFPDAAAYLEDFLDETPDEGFTDAEIDAALEVARQDIAAGRVYSVDEMFDQLAAKYNITFPS